MRFSDGLESGTAQRNSFWLVYILMEEEAQVSLVSTQISWLERELIFWGGYEMNPGNTQQASANPENGQMAENRSGHRQTESSTVIQNPIRGQKTAEQVGKKQLIKCDPNRVRYWYWYW